MANVDRNETRPMTGVRVIPLHYNGSFVRILIAAIVAAENKAARGIARGQD